MTSRCAFSRIARLLAMMGLLLAMMPGPASAAESCEASFRHSGSVKAGLAFSASRNMAGLSPREAIDQYKRIVLEDGFTIAQDQVAQDRGELIFSQPASVVARGFDLRFVADGGGNVSVSMQLPAGMDAKPDAIRDTLCESLGKLRLGATGPVNAGGEVALPAAPLSPPQITSLCLAHARVEETELTGEIFSTWSIGAGIDVPTALAKLKQVAQAMPGVRVERTISHGNKASLRLLVTGSKAREAVRAPDTPDDELALPIQIDLDASLAAASLTSHLKPGLHLYVNGPMQGLACTMLAVALDGAALPQEKKTSKFFHFRNPFKSEDPVKEVREREAAFQKAQAEEAALEQRGMDLLYAHAVRAGKAIVLVPMRNVFDKFRGTPTETRLPGGSNYPAYRFDQTATVTWRSVEDRDDLLMAGPLMSLAREGISGFVQSAYTGKTLYGVYLVDPGHYELDGLTYQQPHTMLPALSSEHWSEGKPQSTATFVITREGEFYQGTAWEAATYHEVTVDDGTYCTATWTPGSTQGCARWERSYHKEKQLVDPGGLRVVTKMRDVDGLAVSVRLDEAAASFEATAGQVLITDGLIVTPESLKADKHACQQAADNVVQCALQSLTLIRVPGDTRDFQPMSDWTKDMPFITRAEYHPVVMKARELPQSTGTYDAAWGTPYLLPIK